MKKYKNVVITYATEPHDIELSDDMIEAAKYFVDDIEDDEQLILFYHQQIKKEELLLDYIKFDDERN